MPERPKFLAVRPTIGVSDVTSSLRFYVDVLGFRVIDQMGVPPTFARLRADDAWLALFQVEEPAVQDFAICYVDVDGVEVVHDRCVQAGAVIASPLTLHPWGMYDFAVEDPDGHRIAVGERRS